LGNAHPNIVPYQAFPVSDGHVIIAVGNDSQYKKLCEWLGAPELAGDSRFVSNAARVENREVLVPLLTEKLSRFTRAQTLRELEARGVPCGPINTVADVFADPQVIARGMRIDMGEIPGVRTPIVFSDAQLQIGRPSPKLGEHTEDILRELKESE
jgi:crotonobetainyl-CoA:carnitine CoA-transferase CaiB-like acyl-CoA transferase